MDADLLDQQADLLADDLPPDAPASADLALDATAADLTVDTTIPPSFTVNDEVITIDSVTTSTPATWNPHLPKLVTDGTWAYAVYTRYTAGVSGRVAWIYEKQLGTTGWSFSGRTINHVHQPPGLALDGAGYLHLLFDCMAQNTCTTGGVSAGTTTRFFDLIFFSTDADGSVFFGDSFANYNEWSAESFGYMGVGVQPLSGTAFASLATSGDQTAKSSFNQQVFALGTASPTMDPVPKASQATANSLYPQMAFAPDGTMVYAVNELVPGWTSSAQYSAVALFERAPTGGGLTQVFSDSVSNPDGTSTWIFGSDLAVTPDGRVYYLYRKVPAVGGHCTYLVRQQSDGSFAAPLGVGCHGSYPQLQINSAGSLYLLEAQGADLLLRRSTDDGLSWTPHTLSLSALPAGTKAIVNPTLVKRSSSPSGFDPDTMMGIFAGMNTSDQYWFASSFSIQLSP